MRRSKLILGLAIVFLLAFGIWLVLRLGGNPPVLSTYSMNGTVTLINDCDGVGANNPDRIVVHINLWYDTAHNVTAQFGRPESVAMVLQADGVTSIGRYNVSDVPTNRTGIKLDIKPNIDECAHIRCPPPAGRRCYDARAAPPMPIWNPGLNTTHDITFSCSCTGL